MRHALRDEASRDVKCVREWNTNGRTCHVAQHVLAAIFRTHSMEELSNWKASRTHARGGRTRSVTIRAERLYPGRSWWIFLSRTGAIVDDEETEEELRKM